MSKIHIALNTQRFDASVAFYRAFFGREPVKHKPGYAKFDLDEPGLNLTLNEGKVREPGALNHLGIQVASSAEVTAASARLSPVASASSPIVRLSAASWSSIMASICPRVTA